MRVRMNCDQDEYVNSYWIYEPPTYLQDIPDAILVTVLHIRGYNGELRRKNRGGYSLR